MPMLPCASRHNYVLLEILRHSFFHTYYSLVGVLHPESIIWNEGIYYTQASTVITHVLIYNFLRQTGADMVVTNTIISMCR